MFRKIATTALSALAFSSLFASAAPTAQLTKQDVTIVSNCVNKGQVALTFDDGLYQYELDVVKHLGDSKATFFINGNSKSYRFVYDQPVLTSNGPSTDFGCIYDRADEL
jgi:peptidoglycan/xylan/chitin deacetylase (PgdA/CDA1 family)